MYFNMCVSYCGCYIYIYTFVQTICNVLYKLEPFILPSYDVCGFKPSVYIIWWLVIYIIIWYIHIYSLVCVFHLIWRMCCIVWCMFRHAHIHKYCVVIVILYRLYSALYDELYSAYIIYYICYVILYQTLLYVYIYIEHTNKHCISYTWDVVLCIISSVCSANTS